MVSICGHFLRFLRQCPAYMTRMYLLDGKSVFSHITEDLVSSSSREIKRNCVFSYMIYHSETSSILHVISFFIELHSERPQLTTCTCRLWSVARSSHGFRETSTAPSVRRIMWCACGNESWIEDEFHWWRWSVYDENRRLSQRVLDSASPISITFVSCRDGSSEEGQVFFFEEGRFQRPWFPPVSTTLSLSLERDVLNSSSEGETRSSQEKKRLGEDVSKRVGRHSAQNNPGSRPSCWEASLILSLDSTCGRSAFQSWTFLIPLISSVVETVKASKHESENVYRIKSIHQSFTSRWTRDDDSLKSAHSKARDARNSRSPLSLMLSIMPSTTRSHCPFDLYVWLPYHLSTLGRIHKPTNFLLPCAYGSIRNSSHVTIPNRILHRHSVLTTELLGHSTEWSFSIVMPIWWWIFLGFLSDLWPNLLSLRKIVSLFFVAFFLVECKFSKETLPRWIAAWWVTIINIPHIKVFTSWSSILSCGSRLSRRLKFEWTLSRFGTLPLDTRRSCCHFESCSSLMSKCVVASFLARSEKFWFWFVSATTSFLARSLNLASDSHTWKLDAASFWFEPPAAGFPAHCAVRFEPSWLGDLSILGRQDSLDLGAVSELAAERQTRFNVGFDFATIPSSCSLLHSFRHRSRADCWAENADIEQKEKIVPLITCDVALCQYVCEMVFGFDTRHLDFWAQFDSVK